MHPRRAYPLTRDLVVRGFGLCALLAIVSAWVQLPGLVGPEGVVPTVDAAGMWGLHVACALGCVASTMLMGMVLPGPAALVVYGTYLAVVLFGWRFFHYQWDALLLEGAVLVGLIAPWRLRGWRAPAPHWAAVWAVRLLVFKLMLFAGLVKVWSGDPTWADWTALTYHYWTQPLPNGLSWWAHQLPTNVHRLTTGATLVVELALPWMVLLGRPGRLAFLAGTVCLMAGVALTGSYGTFQGLTVVLALSLLDDDALHAVLGPARSSRLPEPAVAGRWRAALVVPPAVALLVLNGLWVGAQSVRYDVPDWWRSALQATAPARVVNPYGLFAVMTRSRAEIAVEVRLAGGGWVDLPFRYKPGDPQRSPTWPATHLPRLDWHLWFTALRRCQPRGPCLRTCGEDPALAGLLDGVLERRTPVLGLLAEAPAGPPVEVRAVRWDYRPADWDTAWTDGVVWTRARVGLQCGW
jgi:hypothetical protein